MDKQYDHHEGFVLNRLITDFDSMALRLSDSWRWHRARPKLESRVVNGPTRSGPEPETISRNSAWTRKLIWSPNHAPKNPKVELGLKNLAILPSYFDYFFVHQRQKVRLRPELSPKFLSTLGPNPTRKARPDLQLRLKVLDSIQSSKKLVFKKSQ